MKTSNKILAGFFGLVGVVLFLFLIFIRFNLSPSGWGEGEKLIEGTGTFKTEQYNVSGYNDIRLGENFEVILQNGSEFLEITTDENLFPYIKPEVKDGRLYLNVDKTVSLKPSDKVKKTIGIQHLEKLHSSGSSYITMADTLKSELLEVGVSGSGVIQLLLQSTQIDASVAGSGNIQLQGTSQEIKMMIAGSGRIHAADLMAQTVDARISGSGDASIHAVEFLNVGISGSGHLAYKGQPQIRKEISGAGRLSVMD